MEVWGVRCLEVSFLELFYALRLFGGNTHCLSIALAVLGIRLRSSVILFMQTIASYSLTSVSSKLLKSISLTRVLTSSVIPHLIFAHKISKINPLNQMNCCTIGPYLVACARNPKLEEKASDCLAVMHHIPWCSVFIRTFFDLPVRIEPSLAGFIGAGGALNLCSQLGSASSLCSQTRITLGLKAWQIQLRLYSNYWLHSNCINFISSLKSLNF